MDESGERACIQRSSFVAHLCNTHESGSSESPLDVHRLRTGAAAATLKTVPPYHYPQWRTQGKGGVFRHVFRAVPNLHLSNAHCVLISL